jgi:hypothetical protein
VSDAEALAATVFGVLYAFLLGVGVLSTLIRAVRLKAARITMPRLLGRDLALVVGHAVSFTGFMWLVTHHDVEATVLDDPFWWLLTAVPACVSMAVYVYYELFVIGQ